jgi:hypothetical protein
VAPPPRPALGVCVTPEARSLAACSGVLRCAVGKCPPLASVESADAAWRPAGAHERPMGVRRGHRYGHRCPHTFCPLTDSVKSRRTRSDLDGDVLVRWVLARRQRGSRARQTMRYRYQCVTALADCRGNRRVFGFRGAGGGRGSRRVQSAAQWPGLAGPGGRRVWPGSCADADGLPP